VEVYAYRAPAPSVYKPSQPVLALVDQAAAQRAAGDLTGAAATLERALRIEPRNAHLWNRLARIRLEQGRYGQANSLAAKSNALAGGAEALRRDNQSIVAAARRGSGG
jgi:Flp pilus assembly protein TadD